MEVARRRMFHKSTHSILFYGFILLTMLLVAISTELIHNEAKSLDQTHIQHNSIPQTPLFEPIQLKNHSLNQNDKKKIHVSKYFRNLLSTKNPIWSISFKILSISSKRIFKILYHPLRFLFNSLNFFLLWFWDQIIFPITFPIRLACWIMILKPIGIVTQITKKLKPLIAFLISGITVGVLIGMMGIATYFSIADRLFPLYRQQNEALIQPALQVLDSPQNRSVDGSSNSLSDNENHPTQSSQKTYYQHEENYQQDTLNLIKNEQDVRVKGMKKLKARINASDSEISTPEEDKDFMGGKEEDWPLEGLESRLTDSIKSKKIGYSSAIESIINYGTRKRPDSTFNQLPTGTQPSPKSILNHPDSSNLLLPPILSSDHQISCTSPYYKKKITLKTD